MLSRCLTKQAKFVSFFVAVLLLSSCSPSNTPPPSQPSPSPVHVDSYDGLNCSPTGWTIFSNALTLASPSQHFYTSDEITQMAHYVDQAYDILLNDGDQEALLKKSTPHPKTLQLVPVSLTNSIGTWNLFPDKQRPGCLGNLTITNISNASIVIKDIKLQLAGEPQRNKEHYRLFNVCSLPIQAKLKFAPGTFPICPSYPQEGSVDTPYEFSLHMAKAGSMFPGVEIPGEGRQASPTHPSLSLKAGERHVFHLNIRTAATDGNFKYTITPQLVITTPGQNQEQTLALTQFETTLAYANPDQVSCDTLQGGNTFVPLKQAGIGMKRESVGKDIQYNNTWCI